GRRVTGRLALQLSAGPQVFNIGPSLNHTDWTLSSALTYQTARASYSFGYSRGVSAGSGTFEGAVTHRISGSMRYSLTRLWTTSSVGGYALNRALTIVPGVNNSYGNYFGNASLERILTPQLRLRFDYALQQQNAGTGACPATGCTPTNLRQVGG